MKKTLSPKTLTVVSKEQRSPELLRIWFSYSQPSDFSTANEGDYLKLLFPVNLDKPLLRTYTVAEVNTHKQQLAIDFVLHGEQASEPSVEKGGYAHYFAVHAKVGDCIDIAGPNSKQDNLAQYSNTLYIADSTAVPVLNAIVNNQAVQGHLLLVTSHPETAALLASDNLSVECFVDTASLTNALTSRSLEAYACVWCAGEFNLMRAVRNVARDYSHLDRDHTYFSSYWKHGVTEDGHKVIKRQDNQSYTAELEREGH